MKQRNSQELALSWGQKKNVEREDQEGWNGQAPGSQQNLTSELQIGQKNIIKFNPNNSEGKTNKLFSAIHPKAQGQQPVVSPIQFLTQ